MLRRTLAGIMAMVGLVVPMQSVGASGASSKLGLIARDDVHVRAKPSDGAKSLAVLVQQSQVHVIGHHRSWDRIDVWSGLKGWVRARDVVFRRPWVSQSTYVPPKTKNQIHAHPAQSLNVRAEVLAATALHTPAGTRQLPAGRRVTVRAWRQDAHGHISYQIGSGWASGDNVRFIRPSASRAPNIWHRISGKGMWMTLGPVTDTDPAAVIATARRAGVTHLYVESAISPLGFHGRDSVGPLIDAAHDSGIAVIAWVYPYLSDVAADVQLTRTVAAFRTPAGFGFDGIAADLETNLHLPSVRAYSQLIRAYLGNRYLLVGVTYPPQSLPDFPFGEIARQYDAIAPMDYWHQTKTAYGLNYGHMRYGWSYGYRYAKESIATIKAEAGGIPITPIGQTFDDFGRLEMGPYAPSAAEVSGFLAGCKAGGAVGASFFQWMTATAPEWAAIGRFHF